jgi:hypothetical protein
MKAKTILILKCACDVCRTGSGGCVVYPDGKIPIGTVIEHQDAWKLVRLGCAVPADDECAAKANMTQRQMAVAQHAQRRAAAGIHPEDFDAYDRGEMVGYFPDGSWIPGENADESEGGLILP